MATAAAVAAGSVSAVDTVTECLRRVEELDGDLGSVVALRAQEALADAARLDERRRLTGRPAGPLDGVPVLVKDLEDVAGMPTRQGSLLLADAPAATSDEPVPAALRRAGAVVVGKTNLPEFAIEGYTDNLLDGLTRNPWDPAWSPGGSSGGSAAAIAAGLAPVATGTDGGGSVRIPAALCGLVAIKPTHGAVARWPAPDWLDLSTYAPMATTVADLRLLLGLMVGVGAGDPSSAPWPGPTPAAGYQVRRLVAAVHVSATGPRDPAVAAAFDAAVADMAQLLGITAQRLDPSDVFPGTAEPGQDWFVLAAAEHVAALGRDRVRDGLHRMHPASAAFLAQGLAIGVDEYLAARRRRADHTRRVDELLGVDGLLLTPAVAVPGILADGRLTPDAQPGLLPPGTFVTDPFNITGHPAVSVPAGGVAGGRPFGLQLIGPRWRDDLVLDVAARWEAAHPWPLTAPGYPPFVVPPD